jgi:hypothetical protein
MIRTGRSLASWLAEAVVIVLSILLAFGLDATWDEHHDRKAEARLRASLVREFRSNRDLLEETMAGVRRGRSRIEAVAGMGPEQILALPDDSAWVYLDDLSRPYTAELNSGVTSSAVSSGTLTLIQDEALRESIAGWLGRIDDIHERAGVMVNQEAYVETAVDHVAAELRLGLLTPSDAAELLHAIRSDDETMARVARKHVQSGIYLDELAVLLARLDSTLVLLDGSNGS